MIKLESIYKSFEGRTVLDDINFSFEDGKTNLIIGQSGSGKTVLIKCIVGLLTPERGISYTTAAISTPWIRKRRKPSAVKWE